MKKNTRYVGAVLLAFLALTLSKVALAHETVTAGPYAIEYGWLNEPVIVDEPNALVLNFGPAEGGEGGAAPEVDVSNLKIEVVFGSDSKVLALQPLGEDTPGQFVAPILPTRMGQYVVRLSGHVSSELGDTDVNVEVQPEAVEGQDLIQFPSLSTRGASSFGGGFGINAWMPIAGLVSGVLGLIVALVALLRKR